MSNAASSSKHGRCTNLSELTKRLVLPAGSSVPQILRHEWVNAHALTRHDLEDDVAGINASLELIRHTRGGPWPSEPVTVDGNFVDLVWHECEFRNGSSYTYVLTDRTESYIGCLYLYPVGVRQPLGEALLTHDVDISWWVTPEAYAAGAYRDVYQALQDWLGTKLPFEAPLYSNALHALDDRVPTAARHSVRVPAWPTLLAETNGATISYQRTGMVGPTAVLLHGLMGSGAVWTPVARLLEAELDVILPDARGHGGSSAPAANYRYPDLAMDVVGLIQEIGLHRPVLIGHSMGGMTAALVATHSAQLLRGLVLVDPTFLNAERQNEVYQSDVAGQHRDLIRHGRLTLLDEARRQHPRRSPELIELQVDARLRTNQAAFDILRPPNPPYRDLVSALDVPTLLVIGDKTIVTPDMAVELAERNPLLRVEQVSPAGHGLPFDQPQRLANAILNFIRSLPGAN